MQLRSTISRVRDWVGCRRPELVTADPDVPVEQTVRVHLVCDDCLESAPPRSARGWDHWWLQHLPGRRFVRVTLPRGDVPVDVVRRLQPGRYLLGVGRGDEAIRVAIRVPPKS